MLWRNQGIIQEILGLEHLQRAEGAYSAVLHVRFWDVAPTAAKSHGAAQHNTVMCPTEVHRNSADGGGVRTHASEEIAALTQRLRSLGHATTKPSAPGTPIKGGGELRRTPRVGGLASSPGLHEKTLLFTQGHPVLSDFCTPTSWALRAVSTTRH